MHSEIQGKKVCLRRLEVGDLAKRSEWTADDDLARMMGIDVEAEPFICPEDELRRNEDWFGGRQRAGAVLYAIDVDGQYIGDIDIEINNKHTATLSIFIGDRSQWGKGYGTEAIALLLLELRRYEQVDMVLATNVADGNVRAHRLWRRLGFHVHEQSPRATTYVMTLD